MTCGNPAHVKRLREAALRNGYHLLRVHSRGKAPLSPGWHKGETNELLLGVTEDAANTGMLCSGFRVIDVDVDDPQLVHEITAVVRDFLPRGGIIRRRAGSPRYAIVLRAHGEPGKRSVSGSGGKVEVLGGPGSSW